MSAVACEIAKQRAAATGVGTIDNPVKYGGQDYEKLKAKCLASGTLFEDPAFPAAQSSLGVKKFTDEFKSLEWKRPKEICDEPFFIKDGATRDDIKQGDLGNCWLLSAVASLTMNEECLNRVIPGHQTFKANYAGIFNFRFWLYGDWTNVVVDDRLPTRDGKLIFLRSDGTEFWSALLEKAYAKVSGCYQALKAGYTIEPLTDFTAGVVELLNTNEVQPDLLKKIKKTFAENSFLTGLSNELKDADESSGIFSSHIYSITGLEEVDYDGGKVQLIRVRNPWGSDEGTGAWSDGSPEWNKVDPKVKAKLHENKNDGEFWMKYSDFLNKFRCVEICNLSLSETHSKENYQWHFLQFHGRWITGSNAGGNLELETFWTNPKYTIKLQDPDKEGKLCTMLVALTQKGQRRKQPFGGDFFKISFYIFKINGDEKLGKEFFNKNKLVAKHAYKRRREVLDTFELPPGDYVIVPATAEAAEEADFYLRIYTVAPAEAQDVGKVVIANPFELKVNENAESEPEFKDLDENGEYNGHEVKKFLDKWISAKYKDIKFTEFSMKTISDMIKLVDLDNTNTLSTQELKALWIKVIQYTNIFCSIDADKTGTIDAHELRNALQKADFTVNDNIMENLVQRYINKENLTLSYNDFISCMIQLETLFSSRWCFRNEGVKAASRLKIRGEQAGTQEQLLETAAQLKVKLTSRMSAQRRRLNSWNPMKVDTSNYL